MPTRVFIVIVLLYASCLPAQILFGEVTYDLVLSLGRVIDPETNLDAVRYIGINGGTIGAFSEDPITRKAVLDAKGARVAPGFIDFHAHGQDIPADRMQALDGVTTALELESGILPVGPWYDIQKRLGNERDSRSTMVSRRLGRTRAFPCWKDSDLSRI